VAIWLPSRCLAIDVCSGSTIPAFRRHVTILSATLCIDLTSGLFPPGYPIKTGYELSITLPSRVQHCMGKWSYIWPCPCYGLNRPNTFTQGYRKALWNRHCKDSCVPTAQKTTFSITLTRQHKKHLPSSIVDFSILLILTVLMFYN
jgi:hypothetical protein